MPPASQNRVRRTISDIEEFAPNEKAKVLREKKAIRAIIDHLRQAQDYQHAILDETFGVFAGVLRQEPDASTADSVGVEFMGSSELYEVLHGLMNGMVNANRRIEDLNRRAEV